MTQEYSEFSELQSIRSLFYYKASPKLPWSLPSKSPVTFPSTFQQIIIFPRCYLKLFCSLRFKINVGLRLYPLFMGSSMSSPFPKIFEFLTANALGPPLALISSPLASYFHTSHLHLFLLLSLPDIVNFTK